MVTSLEPMLAVTPWCTYVWLSPRRKPRGLYAGILTFPTAIEVFTWPWFQQFAGFHFRFDIRSLPAK